VCDIVLSKGDDVLDVQLKRGLLEVCVLSAIKYEPSYGYQIVKDMKPYVEITESTLYPILRRLEAAQYLTVQSAEHNGRLRKYYHITDLGRQRLKDFAAEWKEILSIYQFVVREERSNDQI
jgi:PadR family transcriptional regulator PadR